MGSRADGTNPRAQGTNPRAVIERLRNENRQLRLLVEELEEALWLEQQKS